MWNQHVKDTTKDDNTSKFLIIFSFSHSQTAVRGLNKLCNKEPSKIEDMCEVRLIQEKSFFRLLSNGDHALSTWKRSMKEANTQFIKQVIYVETELHEKR